MLTLLSSIALKTNEMHISITNIFNKQTDRQTKSPWMGQLPTTTNYPAQHTNSTVVRDPLWPPAGLAMGPRERAGLLRRNTV